MSVPDVPRRRTRPANDIQHTQAPHLWAPSSPPKTGDAHRHVCTCRNAYSRVTHAQSVPARAPVTIRTGGAALQVRGATEGKGGGIEGADARQSAARSTAPRWTHAQTTSSCWNTLAGLWRGAAATTCVGLSLKLLVRGGCRLSYGGGRHHHRGLGAAAGAALIDSDLPRNSYCTHASLLD